MTNTISPPLSLRVVDATDLSGWDAFARETSEASFAHLAAWRHVIEDVMGHQHMLRVAQDSAGNIAGILPLALVRSRVFGRHLVSVPFMNYGGPIGSAPAREHLARWAMEEAHRLSADSLQLRTRHVLPGPVPASSSKVTVVLPLPRTSDELWNGAFDAKFRNKIKRPQRDGMTTRFGDDQLDAFYAVFSRNMRDLGTPVLPRSFFETILAKMPGLSLLGATYFNDRPVAAGFGFIWRGEFEMTWSSSVKELRAQKPNMLLYWDYMRELIARGVGLFNFGRSTPGSGPHEFKLAWGGKDEPLPWAQWPPAGTEGREGRAAHAAAAVWRRLPLPLTNSLGPILARQLPWW